MNPAGVECRTCYFWERVNPVSPLWCSHTEVLGTCRRSAPEQSRDPGQNYQTAVWPITRPTDWCGEWRNR